MLSSTREVPPGGGKNLACFSLAHFIGRPFPHRDDPEEYEFYCALMLMLLKPWRNLAEDLKPPSQTWQSAFEEFLTATSQQGHCVRHSILSQLPFCSDTAD